MLHANAIAWAIAVAVSCALSSSSAVADDGGCARGPAASDASTRAQTSASVLCLVNRERARRGRAPLRVSRPLERAAQRHSRDMVARQYFSHVSPNGMNVRQRALRAGYIRLGRAFRIGEAIAWGSEGRATPAQLVRTLMNSVRHRRVVLARRYRHVGVGLVLAAPVAGVDDGVTLTLDLGRR